MAENKFDTPEYREYRIIPKLKDGVMKHSKPFVSKEQFQQYRDQIMSLNDNPLLQATYYFVINRSSFSGATLSGGFSKTAAEKRFTKSSIDRVSKLNLNYMDFENSDYDIFFQHYLICQLKIIS